ncbi:MAG: hypothetical protein ACM3S1_08480 [Hyphomicrobiales bacterium]
MKLLAVVAAIAAGFAALNALAQPQIPATFYGSASIDGQPVPDGTAVRAFIDGKDCTQGGASYKGTVTDGGVSAYTISVMHESQAEGCGRDGKTITFTIGGRDAAQTATWAIGPHRLDLNAGAGEPQPLPTPTPTPTLDPTRAIEATATAAATLTPAPSTSPVPGTPPTDPIELPALTPRPPGGTETVPAVTSGSDGGGGTSTALFVLGALLVVAAIGGAGGYWLSRRGRPPANGA